MQYMQFLALQDDSKQNKILIPKERIQEIDLSVSDKNPKFNGTIRIKLLSPSNWANDTFYIPGASVSAKKIRNFFEHQVTGSILAVSLRDIIT